MKKSKFTDSQILAILKAGRERDTRDRALPPARHEQCGFLQMAAKYGGMDASLMARLRELEQENARLKRMYADAQMRAEVVQEARQKSGEAVSTR